MVPDRDWTETFGLNNPKRNGSLDPEWIEDVLWFLCMRVTKIQTKGCDKFRNLRLIIIGVVLGAPLIGGAFGPKFLSIMQAVWGAL